MATEWDLKKLLKIVAVGDIFHRLDVIFDNQPQWQSTEGSVVNHWQAVRLKTNSESCSCVVFMCSATHIMLGTGEKKLLNRHNRAQRVAAAKQLLVPAVTSDSASLNVKVTCIFLFVTLQSMLSVILCVKAKFHYTIWFEAGRRQVRSQIPLRYLVWSWFKAGCIQVRSWLNLSVTSFEPASIMEFGFNWHHMYIYCCQSTSHSQMNEMLSKFYHPLFTKYVRSCRSC